MRRLRISIVVSAIAGLLAGGASAQDVDFTNLTKRIIVLKTEDTPCQNPSLGDEAPPPPTDNHFAAGDPGCLVFAADGAAVYTDSTNDYFGTLEHTGGTTFRIDIKKSVYAQVVAAAVPAGFTLVPDASFKPVSMSINTATGSVTPIAVSGNFYEAVANRNSDNLKIWIGGKKSPGRCTGNISIPCLADAECAAATAGTCGVSEDAAYFASVTNTAPRCSNNPLVACTTNANCVSPGVCLLGQPLEFSCGGIEDQPFDSVNPTFGPTQAAVSGAAVCDAPPATNYVPSPGVDSALPGTFLTALTQSRTNIGNLENANASATAPVWAPFDWKLEELSPYLDTDGDFYPDSADNCTTTATTGDLILDQSNTDLALTGGDALGDACDTDDDADGDTDLLDNCRRIPNPAQCNGDADAWGNQCDPDTNNIGAVQQVNVGDFNTWKLSYNAVPFVGGSIGDTNCSNTKAINDFNVFKVIYNKVLAGLKAEIGVFESCTGGSVTHPGPTAFCN